MNFGGIRITFYGDTANLVTTITNSTISGNHAQRVGGVSTNSATINLRNSTIARSTADFGTMS